MKATKAGFAMLMMGVILAIGVSYDVDFLIFGILSGAIGMILVLFDKEK